MLKLKCMGFRTTLQNRAQPGFEGRVMNAVLGLTELTTRPHHLLHQQGITASPFNSLSSFSCAHGHFQDDRAIKPSPHARNLKDISEMIGPPHIHPHTLSVTHKDISKIIRPLQPPSQPPYSQIQDISQMIWPSHNALYTLSAVPLDISKIFRPSHILIVLKRYFPNDLGPHTLSVPSP